MIKELMEDDNCKKDQIISRQKNKNKNYGNPLVLQDLSTIGL